MRITIANSIKSRSWQSKEMTWEEFVRKCKEPEVVQVSYEQLMTMEKDEKARIKDGPCFVGGEFMYDRRRKQDLVNRSLVTLDVENDNMNFSAEGIYRLLDAYGAAAVMYTTISHGVHTRCRVVFKLNRNISPEEYEPVARYLARVIGMELMDRTTFDTNRAMFFPKVCYDGEFEAYDIAGDPVNVERVLARYKDWRNPEEWPVCPDEENLIITTGNQEDPTEKKGWVGDFCRAHDIRSVIEHFELPYRLEGGRATYELGTSSLGCEIFDDGKFIYSHHSSDPISGRLCNVYDFVRIVLFGDDEDSYQEMVNLMTNDEKTLEEHQKSSMNRIAGHMANEKNDGGNDDGTPWDWENELTTKKNKAGDVTDIKKTLTNFRAILENDKRLKNNIRMNNFSKRLCITGPVPWLDDKARKIFENADDSPVIPKYVFEDRDFNALQMYISESYLNLEDEKKLSTALDVVANKNSFNELRDYFRRLPEWDGVPRLDTLFIDFLGAEDNEFNRAVCRKVFVCAVTRVMSNHSIKWDDLPVLYSQKQGLGKSTVLKKMGMIQNGWFTDSIVRFDDPKVIAEKISGKLIVELGEMSFLSKSDIELVKQMLSSEIDTFRPAYGKLDVNRVRKCVFISTANHLNLKDDQNRRFLPIKCDRQPQKKSPFTDLTEDYVNKVWAEAYKVYLEGGEKLFVENKVKKMAMELQAEFKDENPIQGQIEDWLSIPIKNTHWTDRQPEIREWYQMHHFELDGDYSGHKDYDKMVQRDKVNIAEIWMMCLGKSRGELNGNRKASSDIVKVMDSLPDWERTTARFGYFGRGRGWKRRKQ